MAVAEKTYRKKSVEDLYKEEDYEYIRTSPSIYIVDKNLHIPDPYEIILLYFNYGNINGLTHGSLKGFKWRVIFMLLGLIIFQAFVTQNYPSILWAIIGVVAIYFIIELVLWSAFFINTKAQQNAGSILFTLGLMTCSVIILGNILYLL